MKEYYEENFKKQIVCLYSNGETLADINRRYGIAKSTVKEWVKRYNKCSLIGEEEKELIVLRKKVRQLQIDNDILKQAALILIKM
ncbi:helix-turn-helix domain-containing protein [Haloimpatiens lingqiaonensis]|uniref:helix-turn-helix domain-containing protein n=1 Tax=Haloimpatiens lingqiaonensis TaxID=1380675 RepID=UPI0010FE2540|nr:helix-turn-helix domain-containing protein [Haloimpatiens lingqiaonensis]